MVTNLHVVSQDGRVTVRVNDSNSLSATFLGYDAIRDLAVLRVCCDPNMQSSPLATQGVTPGESVFAMGYPLGIDQASVTSGIVSRVAYDRQTESWMVQTDAPINPGNSGGPLFTLDGRVAGINTFVLRESSSGISVEGFGFAISAHTVTATLPALKAGTIGAPPRPTATPLPTPPPRNRFGPVRGSLEHDPTDGLIKTKYADVSFRDLMVGATFINPYSARAHRWDYGFILRSEPKTADIHIVVTGDRRWGVFRGNEPPRERIGGGTIENFHTGTGQTNRLSVVAVGQRGWFFVNGEFISSLDLSANSGAWDVAVMTGAFEGDELSGRSTRFQDFEGTRLTRRYGPAFGDLKKDTEFDGPHRSGFSTRDFIAEARFISSQSDDWYYGFWFRNQPLGRTESISVANYGFDEYWDHGTWNSEDEAWIEVGEGSLSEVGAKSLSRNHLLLIALEDSGWLFVNNQFVANLDLKHNPRPGVIMARGNSLEGHQGTLLFENFNVWAP